MVGISVATLVAANLAATVGAAQGVVSPAFTRLPNSVNATTDRIVGGYSSARMSVEVVLAPRNATTLQNMLANVTNPKSASYQHWIGTGAFDATFAPTSAEIAGVTGYLRSQGLRIVASSSPFLVRAEGSSSAVTTAFHTNLRTFRSRAGVNYYANSRAIQLPTGLATGVLGVVGLTNTARPQTSLKRANTSSRRVTTSSRTSNNNKKQPTPSCETGYPTVAQLFAAVAGSSFSFGYGGGPGCSGLTPAQLNSIYDAPNVGARGQGKGVTLGLFELSAYQASDINTWARTFYGAGYTAPLTDVPVDGGPLAPLCPVGDQCPPQYNGYAGDIEVDADIEAQLAVAPDANNLLVYNAPNDFTGQTELDEYTRIAADNTADVVSSSWAVCENDATIGIVQAENLVFEQMALQGQSVFGAEGDTGAFSCIRSDGTTIPNVLDPPAQPWVTSVGGTSLESDNPGITPHPSYPNGVETVWNTDDLCSNAAPSAANDNQGGFFWCAATGAGGGGNSQWWGRPGYQFGPGINNVNTTHSNGTTQCALAKAGTPCRETPDVSIDADAYTPYAEYCTGNANTPFSVCGTFSGSQTPPGWFGIGGTSLSSPVWSAIIADRDSFQRHRSGNVNPLLYLLYNLAPRFYFHDINGNHATNNNGLYPTVTGYDLATGIGTPDMGRIITLTF